MNTLGDSPELGPIFLDHLVYATPTLETTVRYLGDTLGVTPSAGGQHPGRGTRNYLLGLGGVTYLEIIGRDPEQPDFAGTQVFGLDGLAQAQLVGWAIRVSDIGRHIDRARSAGYDPGPASAMSRRLPDGYTLDWQLTHAPESTLPVLIPFLIDWGATRHPSETASVGVTLREFHFESPDTREVQSRLAALAITVRGEAGKNALVATIVGPRGTLTVT